MSRHILITNLWLDRRSGTEIVTKRLAIGLTRRGHRVTVYAPLLGQIAQEIRRVGVMVTDRLDTMDTPPDVIHGHHLPTTVTAVARFPQSPALFVCHDFAAWHDAPPVLPSVRLFLGLAEAHVDRMVVEGGVPREDCALLPNAVDLDIFRLKTEIPRKPRNAAVFAKGTRYLDVLRAACAERQIPLSEFGASVGREIAAPEEVFARHDLVFASDLTGMEAMVSGCGLILCDARGFGGMVTAENLDSYRAHNFGLQALKHPFQVDRVLREIDRFCPDTVSACSALARERLDFDVYLDQVETYHERIEDLHRENPPDPDAQARALARHLNDWSPSPRLEKFPPLLEVEALREDVAQLRSGLKALRPGSQHYLGPEDETGWFLPLLGLSNPTRLGRWTEGPQALFRVRLGRDGPPRRQLRLKVVPALMSKRPAFDVKVAMGGQLCANWQFSEAEGAQPRWLAAEIPATAVGPLGELDVTLLLSDTVRPNDLGVSKDSRALGIALGALEVRPLPASADTDR